MDNYIAVIDFGSQNIRIIVDLNSKIIFQKKYKMSMVFQKIDMNDNEILLIKQGLKKNVANDEILNRENQKKSFDYIQDQFTVIYNDIVKIVGSDRIGAAIIVPELYSEIQRHSLKEIFVNAGFLTVSFLNQPNVCCECVETENAFTEIISIGADYFSASVYSTKNGNVVLEATEAKYGLGGFLIDKLLIQNILADTGVKAEHLQILSEQIKNLIYKIEGAKIDILSNNSTKEFALSLVDARFNDVSIDYNYILKSIKPFFDVFIELENKLRIKFENEIIKQIFLTGATARIKYFRTYFEEKGYVVRQIESITILKAALKLIRSEVEDLMNKTEKKPKPEVKTETQEPKDDHQNDLFSYEWSKLVGDLYNQIQHAVQNKEFEKIKQLLNQIDEINQIIQLNIFYEGAAYYYKTNQFIHAYGYIKKALEIKSNNQVVELFENIVFDEIEALKKSNNQYGIKELLQDAKKLGVSTMVKNAFDNENRKLKELHPQRGMNFTKKKKRRR